MSERAASADRRVQPRLVASMFRRHRAQLVPGYLLAITHQTCEALVPVAAGYVIGLAVATSSIPGILVGVAAILLLFAILASSAAYGYYLLGKAAVTEAHLQRVTAVRRILTDATVGRSRQPGELLSITSSDTRAATMIMETVGGLISASVGLTVAAVVLLRIDLTLGIGLMIALAVLVAGVQLLSPYLERRLTARQQAVGLAAAVASDLLSGLRSLRGFGGVAEAIVRYRTASRVSLTATVRATGSTAVVVAISRLATGAMVVLTAAVAARYAFDGRISIAELVTVIGMAAYLMDPIGGITRSVQDLAVSRASGRRVVELLTPPAPATSSSTRRAEAPLALDHVSDVGTEMLTVALRPGELLGVVTTDAATAETLSELIGGRRSPRSGTVCLGTVDVVDLDEAARGARMLIEPHTVHLLGGSLAAALDTGTADLGRRDGDRVGIAEALTAAAIRIEDLAGHATDDGTPRGLDDIPLLDHGTNLSGGQRQRIALARAFLADRDILVLRDPTSAVDAVTENAIGDGLRTLRGGDRSTVVFTTSPLLLGRCDRVVFVDTDGSSTVGRHSDLQELEEYRTVVLR